MAKFDLYGDGERPSREDIMKDKHREHNRRQGSVMRYIGENMASYGCILIVLLTIGTIWTDIGFALFSEKMIIDGIITISMFIVAQYLMTQNGVGCGKEYDVYIKLHEAYLTLRESIYKRGVALMYIFCDWRSDVEYEFYVKTRCKALKLDYEEYLEKYSKLDLASLKKIFTPVRAEKIYLLNRVKPMELTPDVLLTDGRAKATQGGVGESAEEYIEKKTVSGKHISLAFLTGFICVLPAFMLHNGKPFELIIYTVFKLVMLALRMYSGYNNGARAYNTVEVKHIQDKMKYLNLYLEFLDKKIYKSIGEKYGTVEFEEDLDTENRSEDKEEEINDDQRCYSEG